MGYSARLLVKKRIEEKSMQELSLEIGGQMNFLYFFSPLCSFRIANEKFQIARFFYPFVMAILI